MQYVEFIVTRPTTGAALPGAKVTVYLAGTTTLATLFNAAGAGIGNPATADAYGLIGFAAANGSYDFSAASADGSYVIPTIHRQQFYDLSGLDAQVTAAQAAATTAVAQAPLVNTAGTTQVTAVNAAGTTQVSAVNTAAGNFVGAFVNALLPPSQRYAAECTIRIVGSITQGIFPVDYHVVSPATINTFFAKVTGGTGTASVSVMLDGVSIYGPVTVSSVGPSTTAIAVPLPAYGDLAFAVESNSGLTGLALKVEGTRL